MFEWDKEFLQTPVEISPLTFPKQATLHACPAEPFDGLPGVFADQLPDGWGRILLRRARELTGLSLAEVSPLDSLAQLGDRTMGALTFEPAMEASEPWAGGRFALESLQREVRPILEGTPSTVLEAYLLGGAGSQGVRPKIIGKWDKEKLVIGDDAFEAEEWIIKFRAPSDPRYSGAMEYVYSLMAKDAGLETSDTKLISCKSGNFFAAKRFDRAGPARLHMHSLSGVLSRAPTDYSIAYDHLARVTGALTKSPKEIERAFHLALFNVLASNQDDHTRNVAFLMDHGGAWRLAPAYDLTFHRTKAGEHKMSVQNNGAPGVEDLRRFGRTLGISNKRVTELLERTLAALTKFPRLAATYDVPKAVVREVSQFFPKRTRVVPRTRGATAAKKHNNGRRGRSHTR
jgi:serine/threonine-protein kinase HipA